MKKILPLAVIFGLSLNSCLFDSDEKKEETQSTQGVLLWTTDFDAGELRWIHNDSVSATVLSFNNDARLISSEGMVFVLERYGADNLVRIDPTHLPASSAVLYQVPLADYANPADVAVQEDQGWLLTNAKLYAFDVSTGSLQDSIDLSIFAQEGAINPNADKVKIYGDTLVVMMQRLAVDYSIPSPGLLAIYDRKTLQLLDTLTLLGYNPQGMALHGSRLLVGSVGDMMGANEGMVRGVESVDLKTWKSTMLVDAEELTGGVHSFDWDTQRNRLYVSVYKAWGYAPLAIVDAESGDVLTKTVEGISDSEGGIYVDALSGTVYVGDRSESGSVWMLSKDSETFESLFTGDMLPPNGFTSY